MSSSTLQLRVIFFKDVFIYYVYDVLSICVSAHKKKASDLIIVERFVVCAQERNSACGLRVSSPLCPCGSWGSQTLTC